MHSYGPHNYKSLIMSKRTWRTWIPPSNYQCKDQNVTYIVKSVRKRNFPDNHKKLLFWQRRKAVQGLPVLQFQTTFSDVHKVLIQPLPNDEVALTNHHHP